MPQGDSKPDLMATSPGEMLGLAEEGYEEARRIDNEAERSKELRGWWDRRLKVLEEWWRFERIKRLEAVERGKPLETEDVSALRTGMARAPTPPTGRGEVLQ